MWILIMMVIFSNTLCDANEVCNRANCEMSARQTCELLQWSNFTSCKYVILKNKSIENINPASPYTFLQNLDLSYNRLKELPKHFLSDAIAIKEIYLGNNLLEQLPENFLSNSSNLQILQLEGNRLSKIPSSVFHSSLLNLSVECKCDVANSIMQHLNDTLTDHSKLSVTCTSPSHASSFEKLGDFIAKNCGSQGYLILYIVLPILALCLIVGGVILYLWKKKNSVDFGRKTDTEASPSNGQPRYTTRNTNVMGSTSNQGPRQDYENVFIGHLQTKTKPYDYSKEQKNTEAPSKQTMEEDVYLESDVCEGNQPIYSNTQGVYYNYSNHGDIGINKEDDDVYILPDH
ncbi:leucine-rich repeat-containing protein 25 isoform X2 [Lithobates pipiens]